MKGRVLGAALGLALGLVTLDRAAGQENFKRTDSLRTWVHRIALFDADENPIDPRAASPRPYSPRATCKRCHDVGSIEAGWHFSSLQRDAGGRPGEPWILVDRRSATVLPVSFRGWVGTQAPDSIGLDPWTFVQRFGHHLPGGAALYAGLDSSKGRPRAAGALDVDCMACHAADRSYSTDAWSKQVEAGNLAWAPSAAIGLAHVEGAIESLPADLADDAAVELPRTRYEVGRFDSDGSVFFDVVRKPPDASCSGCHDRVDAGGVHAAADVHLAKGLTCADCHGNGLGHHTVRGYEGEENPELSPDRAATCRSCHVASTAEGGGRLGAPLAGHAGLPPLHFDELTCTACHSGPLPAAVASRVRTPFAHGLGTASQTRRPDDLPAIVSPTLRVGGDGRIGPFAEVWPSFFARRSGSDGALRPIAAARVLAAARKGGRVRQDLLAEAKDPADLRARIARILAELAADPAGDAVCYVAGGKAWSRDEKGEDLIASEAVEASAYAWPIAHAVRPARLALGAAGCTDCHAAGAAFFDGLVGPSGPLASALDAVPMRQRFDDDGSLRPFWNLAFEHRIGMKIWTGLGLLVILLGLLRRSRLQDGAGRSRLRRLAEAAFLVLALLLLGSASPALVAGRSMAGGWLLLHVLLAAIFLLPAAFVTAAPVTDQAGRARGAALLAAHLLLVASVGSAFLLFLPLLGTEDQIRTVRLHRFAGLGVVGFLLLSRIAARSSRRG